MKRLFDIVFSLFGLVVLSPVLLALAVLIKKEDNGPVFYRGVRVGRYGRPFRIFKFRTMVVDAESIGGPSTADDDPRITRIGKWLRKYKLDELPQLINVLKGTFLPLHFPNLIKNNNPKGIQPNIYFKPAD